MLDTNVLASGIVGFSNPASAPGLVMRAWREGRFDLALSEAILAELARTLQAPYFRRRLPAEQLAGLLDLLRREGKVVELTSQIVHGVATHPEDDLILATALSARADHLVTGDAQLQQLGHYQGVTIVSPRAFLQILESQAPE